MEAAPGTWSDDGMDMPGIDGGACWLAPWAAASVGEIKSKTAANEFTSKYRPLLILALFKKGTEVVEGRADPATHHPQALLPLRRGAIPGNLCK